MTVIETIDMARAIMKHKLPPTRTFPDNSSSFFEDSEMLDWGHNSELEYQGKLIETYENWFVTSCNVGISGGQDYYSLPCQCLKIVRIEDIDNSLSPIEITPMTFNEKDNYLYKTRINMTSNSDIEYYAIVGNKIVLRPIPSQGHSLKVHYCKKVDKPTATSSCWTLPDQYHELIMWGMVENMMIKQEANAEAMASVLGRRNRLVSDLMTTGENRQVQKSRTVRKMKGY